MDIETYTRITTTIFDNFYTYTKKNCSSNFPNILFISHNDNEKAIRDGNFFLVSSDEFPVITFVNGKESFAICRKYTEIKNIFGKEFYIIKDTKEIKKTGCRDVLNEKDKCFKYAFEEMYSFILSL